MPACTRWTLILSPPLLRMRSGIHFRWQFSPLLFHSCHSVIILLKCRFPIPSIAVETKACTLLLPICHVQTLHFVNYLLSDIEDLSRKPRHDTKSLHRNRFLSTLQSTFSKVGRLSQHHWWWHAFWERKKTRLLVCAYLTTFQSLTTYVLYIRPKSLFPSPFLHWQWADIWKFSIPIHTYVSLVIICTPKLFLNIIFWEKSVTCQMKSKQTRTV